MSSPSSQTIENFDNVNAVIVDIGSETIRAGYSSENKGHPQFDISSIAGIQRLEDGTIKTYFDADIRKPREGMKLNPIIFDGLIQDWDLFEEVMKMIVKRLGCNPKETFFIFSEALHTTEKMRQKLLELMFEKIGCNGIYIKPTSVFQIASRYRSTGLVVDSGASHTSVIPVVDYYALKESYWKADVGGDFLIDQAQTFFVDRNESIIPEYLVKKDVPTSVSSTYKVWAVQETLKEFVQSTFKVLPMPRFPTEFQKVAHVFPNNKVTFFTQEIYELPEGMFNRQYDIVKSSDLNTIPEPTIIQMIEQVIDNSDVSIQYDLRQHVLVTGGISVMPGFVTRIINHIKAKYYGSYVYEPSKIPKYDAFLGAATMVQVSDFSPYWYSQKQYSEGDRSIHEL